MSSGIEGDSTGMTTLAGVAASMSNAHEADQKATEKALVPEKQVDFVELKRGDEPPDDQRMVDDMNMPHHIEGKPRQQKRQGWASYASMQRYVTATYPRGLTINVVELMH
ncbi:hypothetical protein BBJ28_00022564 [Nothophytophthora sp. Chile5]|nr:hypothetical protein BBJ28_00022564 [Nothophytophthora sp. Chile5]